MGLDPQYLYNNSDVIWYGTETYSQALSALQKVTGKSEMGVEMMLNAQYGAADYWTAVEALQDQGVIIAKNTNGYNCFAYASDVTMTAPTGPMYQMDSSATATTMVRAAPTYDVVVDDVATSPTYGKVLTNPMGSLLTPEHGFYGWKFFAGECIQAIGAASAGITLGKVIDSALYNANPDFWDAHGMSSLNPETWNSITNGDDSFAAGLFNMVFGLNPNTGDSQMFMDENALAYLAYYMAQNGVFNPASIQYTYDTSSVVNWPNEIYVPIPTASSGFLMGSVGNFVLRITNLPSGWIPVFSASTVSGQYRMSFGLFHIGSVTNPVTVGYEWKHPTDTTYNPSTQTKTPVVMTTFNGTTFSSFVAASFGWANSVIGPSAVSDCYSVSSYTSMVLGNKDDYNLTKAVGTALFDGTEISSGGIEGISDQQNATLPDTTNWNDIPSTLASLQNQYPDLWNDSVPNSIVQPDGSTKTITYVPVATPNANGQWDTQPTSDTTNSSQASPQVQPQTEPTASNNDLLRLILQAITMAQPQPDTQTQTQTQPQPDIPVGSIPTTGDGSSPTPTPPTGSASALWAVYHPTQAQINSFGAWLWSSNFVDQLLKVFQNPMDAIITLHKVFVTPTDAGTTTIHAGYLDSNVSSAYVTQQYEYVDCGSVDCKEYFGTVFDYIGTNISLYLPFIGIVPLNVDEVMRSSINVRYGCDLFTGAILAEVRVTRDANDVVLYQYGGDGGVQYPVSGSRSGGFITGLAATIGAAASVATGGALLPAAAAAVGGSVMSAQKQVQHSGGFTGNSGAMGCKTPYLIIERPQTKLASTFPSIEGYPTNYSAKLGNLSGQVKVQSVHVENIPATETELTEIETLLKSGVLV